MRCQLAYVIGVDGCRDGWCAVSIHDERHNHRISDPTIYQFFQQVIASSADLICVDIPIGLLDGLGQRPCDVEARKLLGWPRRNSVFTPPSRSVLNIRDHQRANDANRDVSGRGLTQQAFAISGKIAEVDSLLTPALQSRVYEVHPELCFWALNDGRPMSHKKARLVGRMERWRVLRTVLPSLPEEPPRPRDLPDHCAVDDYVDALVAAWTASCIARRSADHIPSEPILDNRGLRMEMWLPSA
jgi:predicted RNase H-like nuclease